MPEQKHSPLPWKWNIVDRLTGFPNPPFVHVLKDGKDNIILDAYCMDDEAGIKGCGDDKTSQANADLIIRAVNEHDKLVEACNAAKGCVQGWLNVMENDDTIEVSKLELKVLMKFLKDAEGE